MDIHVIPLIVSVIALTVQSCVLSVILEKAGDKDGNSVLVARLRRVYRNHAHNLTITARVIAYPLKASQGKASGSHPNQHKGEMKNEKSYISSHLSRHTVLYRHGYAKKRFS